MKVERRALVGSHRRAPRGCATRNERRKRRFYRYLAAAVLAIISSTACRRSVELERTADGLTRVRMHLDWYPQTEYAGYYHAISRGFYREVGLEVGIIPGGPGVSAKEAVALGRAEFGCTDGNDVIVAVSKELPLAIVAAEMQRNPQGILFHESHPLRSFDDLKGRTLMAGPGSAWVEHLTKSRGINFDFVPLTTDLTSFLADETMVRQCFVTQEPFFARQKGAKVGTLLLADSGYAPYRVIFTNHDMVEKRPEIVRAFVAASVRGFEDLLGGDPAPAFAALSNANSLMTPDVMTFSLDAMKHLRLVQGEAAKGERTGLITRERIAGQIEALQSLGQLAKPLTVEDVVVFDFVPSH